ncbi:MFS transporter [Endozoicomonadaceae bacterium StTr2]
MNKNQINPGGSDLLAATSADFQKTEPNSQKTAKISQLTRTGCYLAVLLLGMGQVSLLICLPVFVAKTGIGYDIFAALVGLGTFLFIFAAPVWGKISDTHSRKLPVIVGLLGLISSNGLTVFALESLVRGSIDQQSTVLLMLLGRIIYGLTVAGLYPAVQVWVSESTRTSAKAIELGRVTASISIGRLVGPLLPFFLLPLGFTVPLAVFVVLGVPVLLLVLLVQAPDKTHQKKHTSKTARPDNRQMLKSIWPVALLAVSVTTLFGILQYLAGPILQQRLGYTATDASQMLSLMMTAAAFATLCGHLLLKKLAGARPVNTLLTGGSLLLSGCLAILVAGNIYLLFSGVLLSAASVALLTPVYTTLAMNRVESRQGAVTGLLSTVHTTGYTLGALLAGLIGAQFMA